LGGNSKSPPVARRPGRPPSRLRWTVDTPTGHLGGTMGQSPRAAIGYLVFALLAGCAGVNNKPSPGGNDGGVGGDAPAGGQAPRAGDGIARRSATAAGARRTAARAPAPARCAPTTFASRGRAARAARAAGR